MNTPEIDALILRACQPKSGDKWQRAGEPTLTITEVKPDPDFESRITFRWERHTRVHTETVFIGYYRLMAKRTIERGVLFSAAP